VIEMN